MSQEDRLVELGEVLVVLIREKAEQLVIKAKVEKRINRLRDEIHGPEKEFLALWRELGGVSVNIFHSADKNRVKIGKTGTNEAGGVTFLDKLIFEKTSIQCQFFLAETTPDIQDYFSSLEEWGLISSEENYVSDGIFDFGLCRRTAEGWVQVVKFK
ncbi:hypothetical protein HN858_00315 [Candidatus Falkowbacteria bacterium]|nr:hypothetical protein [Candidatus Falkowbacteria bacterium]MBT6574472.1 hypothetical protein [Candidatus Falkowbacteria bacterium]MBT7348096.1 hypothetical protein [Candidatus Falkowbacteria bacterium]MBT7500739.1 hypothetical protein [Candidatus Falkowbacteria bacterium]